MEVSQSASANKSSVIAQPMPRRAYWGKITHVFNPETQEIEPVEILEDNKSMKIGEKVVEIPIPTDFEAVAEMESAGRLHSRRRSSKKLTKKAKAELQARKRMAVLDPILERKGMTKNGWATKAGYDPSVVYDYCNGRSNPRPNTRNDLAKAIGIATLPD